MQAITLSQLDSLRKDLLRAARDRVDFVLYSKVGQAPAACLHQHGLLLASHGYFCTAKCNNCGRLWLKDVVREILAFADVASGDEALPPERGSGMGPDTPTNFTNTPRSPPLSPIHSFDGNGSYQSFGCAPLPSSHIMWKAAQHKLQALCCRHSGTSGWMARCLQAALA